MKTTLVAALAVVIGSLSFAATAETASPGQRAAMKARYDAMTPEEKAAAREKAKAKWDAMNPEEKAAAKKRFAENYPRAAAKAAEKQKEAAAPAK